MFSAHVFCRTHLCFFPLSLFGFVPPLFDCKARGGASRPRRAGMEDEPGNGKAWSERLGEDASPNLALRTGTCKGGTPRLQKPEMRLKTGRWEEMACMGES